MSDKKKGGFDVETIRQLAELLRETELTEIELEIDDARLRLARELPQQNIVAHVPAAPAPAPALAPAGQPAPAPAAEEKSVEAADHPGVVRAPMVGTAYRAPAPGAEPFVEVGQEVKVVVKDVNIARRHINFAIVEEKPVKRRGRRRR